MVDEPTWERLQDAIEDALELRGPEGARILSLIESDDEELDDPAQALLDEWKIDGTRTAEWAMRKIKVARARIDDTEALAAIERAAIDDWVSRETARAVHDVDFFERKIGAFHRELLEIEPRRKTLALPGGDSKITAGGLSLEVENEDAAVEVLEGLVDNPGEVVKYGATIIKSEVKKRFGGKAGKEPGQYPVVDAKTGTVIAGVKLVRGEATHKVIPTEHEEG